MGVCPSLDVGNAIRRQPTPHYEYGNPVVVVESTYATVRKTWANLIKWRHVAGASLIVSGLVLTRSGEWMFLIQSGECMVDACVKSFWASRSVASWHFTKCCGKATCQQLDNHLAKSKWYFSPLFSYRAPIHCPLFPLYTLWSWSRFRKEKLYQLQKPF